MLEISQTIGVSKSSVSLWVRDIRLTHEQEQLMHQRNERYGAQHAGSRANIIKHRALREQYQQEGRAKARESDLLHAQGCMLYWAEGGKSRNLVQFANSDLDMMKLFIRFIRECLQVQEEKIHFIRSLLSRKWNIP
ncbi:hypothetical protein HC776_00845 [bacterium]|nr:hypothetical protein [bacterium]